MYATISSKLKFEGFSVLTAQSPVSTGMHEVQHILFPHREWVIEAFNWDMNMEVRSENRFSHCGAVIRRTSWT